MSLVDYLAQINDAFPVFYLGEGHLNERLDKFPFDEEGIQQARRWHDGLAKNILEFLDDRFPGLGKLGCLIVCDVQMTGIREKLAATECEYRLYRSIVQRYSSV